MGLEIEGRITSGHATLDTHISDLEFVSQGGTERLVSISGPEGGVAAYTLSNGDLPDKDGHRFFAANQVTGGGHDLIVSQSGGTTYLTASGISSNAITSFTLTSAGAINNQTTIGGASFGSAPSVYAETEGGRVLLADPNGDGFRSYTRSGNSLTNERITQDTQTSYADAIGDIETIRINGTDIAIVASQTEAGVTSYTIDAGAPQLRDTVGRDDGLGIMVPTDIEIAGVDGTAFVIVASEPSAGQSGALSVLQVGANGGLTATDHVLDTQEARFGNVQQIETVEANGHTFVVAGGGDRGLTLFELLPTGQLIHRASVAGTTEVSLDKITALEVAKIGNELQIFVATQGEAGISVLSYDLSGIGDTHVAQDGGRSLTGTGQNETFVDGDGSDTLDGDGGADTFVFTSDDRTDRILNFNPGNDRIDLSGYAFLYDVNSLTIVSTSNGARIEFRDEVLILVSTNGNALSPSQVRAAIDIDINRSFAPPSFDLEGTGADDALEGSWGFDTLRGMGGNDTLDGGDGEDHSYGGAGEDLLRGGKGGDVLFGGDGQDTLHGNAGSDMAHGDAGDDQIFGEGGHDTLHGDTGDDLLEGGEGEDSLSGGGGDDTLDGGTERDTLEGNDGKDLLLGQGGADVLSGHSGNDTLIGGAGDDHLDGGGGDDLIEGREGHDTLIGGKAHDHLLGAAGQDLLLGDEGEDTLDGGGSADILEGGDGKDYLSGGSGDDTLSGNQGHDVLEGDNGGDSLDGDGGRDTIKGGSGRDKIKGGDADDRIFGDGSNDTLFGEDGKDMLSGGKGSDLIEGGRNNDVLKGGDKNDTLNGGHGDDKILGGSRNDLIRGEDGKDLLKGQKGNDDLRGGALADKLIGGDGRDKLSGDDGKDRLVGQADTDLLIGGAGGDTLDGGRGRDELLGGNGNDRLIGGAGKDQLSGQGAEDRLDGGTGRDRLKGGSGKDKFVFQKGYDRDIIKDFDAEEDRLLFDQGLRSGNLTKQQFVKKFAHQSGKNIEFRFADGDTLVLKGVSDLAQLSDTIEFI